MRAYDVAQSAAVLVGLAAAFFCIKVAKIKQMNKRRGYLTEEEERLLAENWRYGRVLLGIEFAAIIACAALSVS